MQIAITGGNGRFARALAEALSAEHAVQLIDERFDAPAPAGVETRTGDLRERDFVTEALADIHAILHFAPLRPEAGSPGEQIDKATRGTYVLATAALDSGVPYLIVGSSLALFERMPAHWKVNEWWRPRPEPTPNLLAPWLAELSVRECVRATGLHALALRFGEIVTAEEVAAQPYNPRWLHLEDAMEAVRRALAYEIKERVGGHWSVFHITAGGDHAKVRLADAGYDGFGYRPKHDFAEKAVATPRDLRPWREVLAPTDPIPSRPIRKVVVFGAGGPVASALAQELAPYYTLRLTDVRPLAEIRAESNPQSVGAPLPTPLDPPHENVVTDVRDYAQVRAACAGMDAIINCTVLRHDPVDAFLVNTVGAYHIAQAATEEGIRRLVQTGPQQVSLHNETDYTWDYDLTDDPPARPGRHLYGHSKYLGQEIMRLFAEERDLEIPNLMYCLFANPQETTWFHPMIVSWRDSALALKCALEAPSLPSPYEEFIITTDLPHGRYRSRKAKDLLGWQPLDPLENLWQDP